MSYNWLAQTNQIRGMNYHNCFRQEVGYCALELTAATADATPAIDYFNLRAGNAKVTHRMKLGLRPIDIAEVLENCWLLQVESP